MKTHGTLTYHAGSWYVSAEPHVMLRLKRVFPKVSRGAQGEIGLSATSENSRDLEWFMDRYPLERTDAVKRRLRKRSKEHREHETLVNELLSGVRKAKAYELALPPREYQRVAADMVLASGGLLCADDLGLGKTVTGICMLSDPRARPALVVTLTALPKQWEAEINRFAPKLTTHVLKKGTPYDIRPGARKRKQGQLALGPDMEPLVPDVIITSYSKLVGWAETLAPVIKSVVYDEVAELRRPESAKYAAAKHLSDHTDFRLGLSATPIHNNGGEIFHVMETLAPGAMGSHNEFVTEWARSEGKMVTNPKALGTHLRASGLMLRRTREEVGRELPALQKVPHYIDCDTSALKDAEDAASELARIILSDKSTFEAKGQASRELDWKLRQATGIAKAPHVAEFVRMLIETGEKVVLFGWHRAVYDIWMERLKAYKPALYTGSESAAGKMESKRRFVDGETPLLIMSLRSGAGLDGLQHHSRVTVHGELDWSPMVHNQCDGRVHRDQQTGSVVAYYLLSDEGSDPVIADVLGIKAEQARGIHDPHADLTAKIEHDGKHAKRLAAAYIGKAK